MSRGMREANARQSGQLAIAMTHAASKAPPKPCSTRA